MSTCRHLCPVWPIRHECTMEAAMSITVWSSTLGALHTLAVCGPCYQAWRAMPTNQIMGATVNLVPALTWNGRRA
jgi:hypothetical protein